MSDSKQRHIKFNNKHLKDFSTELHKKVRNYFEENQLSPYADLSMICKSIIMLILFTGPYIIMVSAHLQMVEMMLLAVVAGVGKAGIGFNIAHDACHSAYSKHPWVNRILGLSFNMIGMSDYTWKIMHNIYHHTYTNIWEKDEALKETSAMRFSPDAPKILMHRYQHIYALPAYSLYTLSWLFAYDFEKLARYNGNGSNDEGIKHPKKELLILFTSKIMYLTVALIIPIFALQMNAFVVIICFVLMHLVAGLLTTIVAQPAHLIQETVHITPDDDGQIGHSWMMHEMITTTNYGMDNKFLTWYTGGLNYQIEHHLFPKICSIHYSALSPIVRDLAYHYSIPYHIQPGLWSALKAHLSMLKILGREEYSPKKNAYARKIN